MPHVHFIPDHFKKEWSRVLIACGDKIVTQRDIKHAVAHIFHKIYENEEIASYVRELVESGDLEHLDDGKYIITARGITHRRKIIALARSHPDPYRAHTRPSYSPNIVECGAQ